MSEPYISKSQYLAMFALPEQTSAELISRVQDALGITVHELGAAAAGTTVEEFAAFWEHAR
ncbi:putative protein OS=Tsukamurella paurometabola (strain ATCC 8368 / DSM / CCUG 35730 /CIP 100753 / JCM 10117 / KCTC 9821 / NBRC 16120 / NCIMB 702349/ NCTC 13040) OX=521096 GN=Tpau_3887 PE=4 SV=1 [Tsukamurella paurometabola]|uniref:Uncharacterized protein n=1 Tax=Tsukamurella paurometabola (strain ATCC 8368 / DSM 20162 / CCUG 35730 / CIP 100753 / JCM 10117 / KCTC 9821 / NBRC 16120 / NCIMB 702349 / NCTC 13040) TaxID=521096 RepID=D5UMI6_TSUPD|nr:hypothetical protein [Tsukamurella paurometabola]ADG80460.1 hypothetical protein Tpau_3887 [Tsukamurella paurometabola DSM 20162]SUP39725.1 Uncharacterised protein [Tsukamurella paurometabola]